MATSALTLRYDRSTGTATFPTHYRDPALVDHAGGLYQVIPVGIFQPSGDAAWNEANDFDLWRGLLREYAEELLGGPRITAARTRPLTTRLAAGAGDDRRAGDGQIRAYCLGLGTDPLTFAMDLLAVVVIDAPLYDELFGALVADNAEGRVIAPRPFDEAAINELTTAHRSRRPRPPCSPWPTRTGTCCWRDAGGDDGRPLTEDVGGSWLRRVVAFIGRRVRGA